MLLLIVIADSRNNLVETKREKTKNLDINSIEELASELPAKTSPNDEITAPQYFDITDEELSDKE